MNKLPLAKTQDIVIQDLGKEILIYDLRINKAFCLNETTSIVFRHCDETTGFSDLQLKYKDLSNEIILLSIDILKKNNLLDSENYESDFGGLSRREVIKKAGMASMLSLPVISILAVPQAAAAQSQCLNAQCTFNEFTQSDCCSSDLRCHGGFSPPICRPCFAQNETFAFASPSATNEFCNAQSNKNFCCNTGLATGDGDWCYCP